MTSLPLLPILLPLLTAAVALLFRRQRTVQRGLALVGGAALQLAAGALLLAVWRDGMLSVQIGDWPAPFGITVVADLFSAALVNVAALLGLAIVIYSLAAIEAERDAGHYYPLVMILLTGTAGAFLAGDLFNLYVWFEVLLMASFVLMALGGEKAQLAGTIQYMTLNVLASALFLTAIGLLYAVAGTLNLAHLASLVAADGPPPLFLPLAMFFLAAFGIKAAIFPLFFWLPPSYPTPPAAVAALFAGLLTEVGVYALVRFFTLLVLPAGDGTQTLLLWLAGLTMLTGILGAVAADDLRRLLAFLIVSDSGFLLMGLGLFSPAALTATVFFFIHVMLVKSNLFLVSGIVQRLTGERRLSRLGGLREAAPWLALCFLLSALSLAGVPPLSGFWAKLALIKAGLAGGYYLLAGTAAVTGLLTLLALIVAWDKVFWGEIQGRAAAPAAATTGGRVALYLPLLALTLLTFLVGLLAGPVMTYAERAAGQLLDPQAYMTAVLGGKR